MDSSALHHSGHWTVINRQDRLPTAVCLSRHYQAYLGQREIILSQATNILGNRDLAVQWFHRPARGLDYRSPCSVVTDDHGYRLVRDYLGRIEYGVY